MFKKKKLEFRDVKQSQTTTVKNKATQQATSVTKTVNQNKASTGTEKHQSNSQQTNVNRSYHRRA